MRKGRQASKLLALGLCVALFGFLSLDLALAQTSKSNNFEVTEAEFGAGAAIETCSGEYCAKATIGGVADGESASENFTAGFGSITADSEPMLEMLIEPGESNLGELTTDRTAHRTMVVHVRSHLAGGYIVQIVGDPPRYEDHYLASPSEPTASTPGEEQFAINLAANTTPEVGQEPLLMPAEDIISGLVRTKYAMPNLYAYTSGDIVAETETESSQVRYTVSMIVNVAGSTPAGHYSSDFSAVVTPVF